MHERAPTLASLLAPLSLGTFFAEFFRRRPTVVHGRDPRSFQDLLSLRDFYELLASTPPNSRSVGLKPPLPGGPSGRDGTLDLDKVLAGYAEGRTVHCQDLHRMHPGVRRLRQALIRDFEALGWRMTDRGAAVVFLTPCGAQALPPHADHEDLFILQVEGRKTWYFHGQEPQASIEPVLPDDTPEVSSTVTVRAGELIYVPRGFVHHAEAEEDFSFAITIGMRALTWGDLIQELLPRALWHSPSFSEPVGDALPADGRPTEATRARLRELVAQLGSEASVQEAIAGFSREPELAPLSDFAAVHRFAALNEETLLARRGRLECRPAPAGVSLVRGTSFLSGPRKLEPLFAWVAAQAGSFRVGDLPGVADAATRIALAQRMLTEGLLALPDPAPPAAFPCETRRSEEA